MLLDKYALSVDVVAHVTATAISAVIYAGSAFMQTAIYAVDEQFKDHISLPVFTSKRLRCDPSIFQFDSCPLDTRQVIYNKDRHASSMKMETVGSSRSDRCLLMACPSSTWDIKLLRAYASMNMKHTMKDMHAVNLSHASCSKDIPTEVHIW